MLIKYSNKAEIISINYRFMAEQGKNKLSFLFEKAKNHKTIAVNGAFGGPSPNSNTIVANFYVQSTAVPSFMTTEVEGNKLKPDTEERVTRGDVVREIQTTIVMSPEDAYSIGEWLKKHAETALKNRNK